MKRHKQLFNFINVDMIVKFESDNFCRGIEHEKSNVTCICNQFNGY